MNWINSLKAEPEADFDYAQMDEGTATEARAAADRYRSRSKAYVMDTGRDLIAIKDQLDHGLFLKWVEAEMGLTPRTAQNFMQAAAQLGAKSEIVSHLPPTTLYKLASPSVPADVREEIVERIEAGEPVTPRAIEERLAEAKEAARKQAAEEKEAARRAALSPEDRAAEDARNKRRGSRKATEEARLKKEREERKRAAVAEKARADEAAHELLARFDLDEAARFLARFEEIDRQVMQQFASQVRIGLARKTEPVEVRLGEIFTIGIAYGFLSDLDDEDKARIEDLAADIRQNGLREPLILQRRPDASYQPYYILDGAYRYQALRQLGQSSAQAYIAPPLG